MVLGLLVAPGAFVWAHHHGGLGAAVAGNWARSLCPHRKGTHRYKQWVEYYTWKYEKRVRSNVVGRGCDFVHQCWISWLLLQQALRLAMAAQALFMHCMMRA